MPSRACATAQPAPWSAIDAEAGLKDETLPALDHCSRPLVASRLADVPCRRRPSVRGRAGVAYNCGGQQVRCGRDRQRSARNYHPDGSTPNEPFNLMSLHPRGDRCPGQLRALPSPGDGHRPAQGTGHPRRHSAPDRPHRSRPPVLLRKSQTARHEHPGPHPTRTAVCCGARPLCPGRHTT